MGKSASTNSGTDPNIVSPDDDGFTDLVRQVSEEIDKDYPSINTTTTVTSGSSTTTPKLEPTSTPKPVSDGGKQKRPALPSFVTPIHSIRDLYTYDTKIGVGVSGSVFLAHSNEPDDRNSYALKQMSRSDPLNFGSFLNEITVLKVLNHPNIIQLNRAYISPSDYFLTTQYCAGGTLLERISKMKRFSERNGADFMKKILEAIDYIHSNSIVHRDLKLSNIVFDGSDQMKIIDFGQSELITDARRRDRNVVGSLAYLPPETLTRRYKQDLFAGDMWSLGVIAFVLINGIVPFAAKNIPSLMRRIKRSTALKWNRDIVISESCKHFIESLLNKDHTQRLNAKEALQHPWIVSQATEDDFGEEYFATLKRLTFKNKLQKVMVSAVLDGMDEKDKRLVLTHDGYVDDNELINQIISGQTPVPTTNHAFDEKALNAMDIDGMLDEIDAESNVLPREKPQYSLKVTKSSESMDLESISVPSPSGTRSPQMEDTISRERFVEILESSPKKYNIPQIIANVSDDGAITYQKIASYHHTIDSLEHEYF
eukprot:31466_1